VRQAEGANALERLIPVEPPDRLGQERRSVEHGEVCLDRLRP
jgi:hypothetical protein